MQQEAKLVLAELLNGEKHEFIIYTKQVVGEGGFGVVKKAIRNDRPHEMLVAKIIPYLDEKKRQKIEKQIQILRQLPYDQNLVSVQPMKCYSSKNYYIFMEFCGDGTLEDEARRQKGRFDETQLLNIFYQIMKGYRVLWNAKILHQDLKPQNILLKNGQYKLTDFGFSIFHEGYKYGNIRQGTLPYMPLEKLTEKQYFANTKSDVYSMGIIMFRLITGHHPYVLNKGKEARQYLKELVNNPLHLKTNFSSKFSIDFQHFFDLILKMISKKESGRIDFDVIFDYIDNTKIFDQFRGKDKKPEKKSQQEKEFNKIIITEQSDAFAIPFSIPAHEQLKYKQEIEQQNKNREKEEEEKIINKIQNYIASQRIIVYFFDRLTRRISVEKMKNSENKEGLAQGEKIILGLHLFCKKIIQNLLKQYKTASVFPMNEWKIYRKKARNMIKVIEKDENYLQDLIIDCLSESSQTRIKERKELLDQSKDNFENFKLQIKKLLNEFLQNKLTMLNPESKNILVTICYILNGIDILKNFKKWENTGLQLQKYFRSVETQDNEVLFGRVIHELEEQEISFSLELGDTKQ